MGWGSVARDNVQVEGVERMWGGAQWHVIMCKLKGWS